MTRLCAAVVTTGLMACGPAAPAGTTSDTSTSDASASATSTSTSTSSTSTTSTGSAGSSGDPTTTTSAFIDCGVAVGDRVPRCLAPSCSTFEQDCPAGQKCAPVSYDEMMTWQATSCVPVDPDPKAVGEPCTVQDHPWSGYDDCEIGAICLWADEETLEGTCVELCGGSLRNPVCQTPDSYCKLTGDGVLAPCLPTCNPLQGDCMAGMVCVPDNEYFTCVPVLEPAAGLGEPCDFVNACAGGLFCAAAQFVPGCASQGCCAEFCDVTDPMCQTPDTECVSWWENATPEPGYENVGACIIPQ